MATIIPGRGWCTTDSGTGVISNYGLLGPLAEGDYLRRLMVSFSVDGEQAGRFAATIGQSEQANEESYRAGMPLIQRSSVAAGNVPCIYWNATLGAPTWFWIPIGIVGSVGAKYVVFYWNTLHEEVGATAIVGLEVLRFKRGQNGKQGQ